MPYIGWQHRDNYVEDGRSREASAPVPWDPRYIERFQSFIAALQAHVERKRHPIKAIAVTGPSNTNGLELALIATDLALEQAQFNRDTYIAAWLRMIDVFARFPHTVKVTLALHDQIGERRRTDIAHAVNQYARAKLGSRYVPMLLAFEARPWFHDGNQYAGMLLKGGSASDGALQAIRIFSANQRKDDFVAMMRRARELQPKWVEIWQEDVRLGYLDCE